MLSCDAPLIWRAEVALENGELIAAGVLLREALRRQLYAIAAQYGVLPRRVYSHRRPLALARRLREAGLLSADDSKRIRQVLHVGNMAAHCDHVDADLLKDAIRLLRQFVDQRLAG